jgi:hypothetical protein
MRTRRVARTDRVTAEDAALNRSDDRDLYPKYVIRGWECICDENGNPVSFDVEAAKELCAQLPDWIFDRIRNTATTPERFLGQDEEDDPDTTELVGN